MSEIGDWLKACGFARFTEVFEDNERLVFEQDKRERAIRELGKIGGRDAAAALMPVFKDPFVHLHDRAVSAWITMLKGGNTYVRMTTAVALGFLRDETAIHPILQRFEKEPSNEVKALLVVALGRIAQRDVLAAHQELARGVNYMAPNAAIALAMRLQ